MSSLWVSVGRRSEVYLKRASHEGAKLGRYGETERPGQRASSLTTDSSKQASSLSQRDSASALRPVLHASSMALVSSASAVSPKLAAMPDNA